MSGQHCTLPLTQKRLQGEDKYTQQFLAYARLHSDPTIKANIFTDYRSNGISPDNFLPPLDAQHIVIKTTAGTVKDIFTDMINHNRHFID